MYLKKQIGFTLIELMVAILIFAVISIISYRTLASLVTTKQIVTTTQDKWNGIGNAISWLTTACSRAIPLVVRDENGVIIPAVIGKDNISGKFDAQLELTLSGYIRDPIYGSAAPKRLGFRYINNQLFLVTWPALNRVITTQPQVDLLMDQVASFKQAFLYPDKQWRDEWPPRGVSVDKMPYGLKVIIVMQSGEIIMRQWEF